MNDERKTLILTGASRGIGHATVKRFAAAGWRVITCSRMAFSEDCPWEAGPEDHVQIDLSDLENIDRGVATMIERLDGAPLNALVNNAAISPKGPDGERLNTLTTDLRQWRDVFHVNFYGPVVLARGLIEALKAGRGSIVNVTSIAGSRVHPFAGTAYSTSKAALASLTREMAGDFGQFGVRVNAISPGEIETAMIGPEYQALAEEIPMARLGRPEEVASLVYYLCSEQASYINGAEIHVNGGQHV
ncbi:MAG: SDR family oxidoreductase [Alphaproteobacteria bacterium]|nr:SDR family oxidoreductase [Alphaproteobacteria bacterium]